jgi:superfamily II DNA or RNA helicase
MIFGVTATPWRGDGFQIQERFGPVLKKMGICEGIQGGFLSQVDYRLLADNLDWEKIEELSKQNYSIKDLNRKLIIPTRDEEAVKKIASVIKTTNRKAGIVFSPTIEHAEHFAGMLRSFNIPAEALHSDIPVRDQHRLMTYFKRGDLKFLTTVDMFNEGVDVPDVDIIVFMRVTHSRRIFVQQLGRGLRVKPEKDKVIVLDFVSDLVRIAEIVNLREEMKGSELEKLSLGGDLVNFVDKTKGDFAREWLLDQASLDHESPEINRLNDEDFNFPGPLK